MRVQGPALKKILLNRTQFGFTTQSKNLVKKGDTIRNLIVTNRELDLPPPEIKESFLYIDEE